MTPAGEQLAAEIRANGPIPFSRFMDVALYHSEHGYYRTTQDPFGIHGDFYTASQVQPVFGRLLASVFRRWRQSHAGAQDFTVVEWGAGRGELGELLAEFPYFALDYDRGAAPRSMEGVIFSNELMDALPVDVVKIREGTPRMMRVGLGDGGFQWVEAETPGVEWLRYLSTLPVPAEGEFWMELPVRMMETLRQMSGMLARGRIVAIDYGYTSREIIRFPAGTLMSYRKHRAMEDVLRHPGKQDITAHVPFTYLEACARELGLSCEPLEPMSRFLLRAGEEDQFASALAAPDEASAQKLRSQLKTLLIDFGESFRCLTMVRPGE